MKKQNRLLLFFVAAAMLVGLGSQCCLAEASAFSATAGNNHHECCSLEKSNEQNCKRQCTIEANDGFLFDSIRSFSLLDFSFEIAGIPRQAYPPDLASHLNKSGGFLSPPTTPLYLAYRTLRL